MASTRLSPTVIKAVVGAVSTLIVLHILFSTGVHPALQEYDPKYLASKLPYFARPTISENSFGMISDGPKLEHMCSSYRWQVYPYRQRRRKIFDLITVNDELDALLLRMHQMDQVDYFIILESDLTFSDHPKPLHVQENIEMFARFRHKMIVHTLNVTGQTFANAWEREGFSRNAMIDQVFPTLQNEQAAVHDDVIIVGDVDEMVRPAVLKALRNCQISKHVKMWTKLYYYSYQWQVGAGQWNHPDATYYAGLEDTKKPQNLREDEPDAEILSAGWHCSYCFPKIQHIQNKVKSFSHQEFNNPEYTTPSKIIHRVRTGGDPFERSVLSRIDDNPDVPTYLLKNPERFSYMLNRDGPDAGFADASELIL